MPGQVRKGRNFQLANFLKKVPLEHAVWAGVGASDTCQRAELVTKNRSPGLVAPKAARKRAVLTLQARCARLIAQDLCLARSERGGIAGRILGSVVAGLGLVWHWEVP